MMGRCLLLFVVIAASAGTGAAAPSPAPTTQPLAVQVDQLLRRLDSDSFAERESAAGEVDTLPLEALPLLEAAIRKAGPDLRSALAGPITRLRQAAGKQSRYQAVLEFFRSQTTGEYDRAGQKNPKWDDAAHRLTEEASRFWAATLLHRYASDTTVRDAAVAVRQSGATDPLLCQLALQFDRAPALQPLVDLWPAMDKSGYSPYCKAHFAAQIIAFAADPKTSKDKFNARKYLSAAAEYWPVILKDEKFPAAVAITQLQQLLDNAHDAGVERTEAFELLDAQLAKQLGEESLVRLNLRGSYYLALANDQRNGTPGAASWEQASRSLEQAEKLLARCDELYPDDGHAAFTMMSVETLQSRGELLFDKWFARAVKADPENFDVYRKKFEFLDPNSFGSAGERLAFARQCLASGHFETRIPLLVVAAHSQNEEPAPWTSLAPRPYFGRDDVWPDIAAAYEGFLRVHPEAADDRAAYAQLAWEAGQWSVAADQYRLLSAAPDWAHRNTGLTRLIQLELPIRIAEPKPHPGVAELAAAIEKRDREDGDSVRSQYVDAYEAFGRKSPKWDEPARAVLAAAARIETSDPASTHGENDVILQMGRSALDAGCDDPLVRFEYQFTVDRFVTPLKPAAKPTCFAAALEVQHTDYSEHVRSNCLLRAVDQRLAAEQPQDAAFKADLLKQLDLLPPLMEAAAAEHQIRPEYLPMKASWMMRCVAHAGGDETAYYGRLHDALKTAKVDPLVLRELRCRYLFIHATGIFFKREPSQKLSSAAHAEIDARMEEARTFAEQLWQEHPERREAVRTLIEIAGWKHEADPLRFWLRQATLYEPYSRNNTARVVWGLTRDTDLAPLAHAAAETHAYRTELPFMLVDYHVRRASRGEAGKPPADLPDVRMISDEETWQDIAGVFEGYLAKYPADSDRRSEYASLACRAGRWMVAMEQLRVLGDHVRPRAFITAERLEGCKKKIAGFEAMTTQPAAP